MFDYVILVSLLRKSGYIIIAKHDSSWHSVLSTMLITVFSLQFRSMGMTFCGIICECSMKQKHHYWKEVKVFFY